MNADPAKTIHESAHRLNPFAAGQLRPDRRQFGAAPRRRSPPLAVRRQAEWRNSAKRQRTNQNVFLQTADRKLRSIAGKHNSPQPDILQFGFARHELSVSFFCHVFGSSRVAKSYQNRRRKDPKKCAQCLISAGQNQQPEGSGGRRSDGDVKPVMRLFMPSG